MENSDVLDIKDGPIQKDVEPIKQEPITDIYKEAKIPAVSPGIIGEKNHAEEIASNVMNYDSQKPKEYDKSIHTSTVQSTGANLSGTFHDQYEMGEGYKATDDEDFSWNKLAKDQAQTIYDQEQAQARFQSVQAKQQINAAASKAWDNYFAAEYSSKQTQDKMGWTGGQLQSHDLQVEFLKAESAANMYSQEEMHKYGVETKLGVARMYADAEQKALALKYYQEAVDTSIREGELTGFYIPAEASEMFKQQKVANDILNDPTSTAEQKNRANNVNAACNKYYESLGFERGYRYDPKTGEVVTELYGIKVLSQLNFEETVRNNKINEELQKQANDLAKDANNIARAGNHLQDLQFQYVVENQNRIETTKILDPSNKSGVTKGEKNFYLEKDGSKVPVKEGVQVFTRGGRTYISALDKNGNQSVKQIYSSEEGNPAINVDPNVDKTFKEIGKAIKDFGGKVKDVFGSFGGGSR